MNTLELLVSRFDGKQEYVDTFYLPYQPDKTVLWWLNKAKERDRSLTLVVSCRAGLCGACGVRVNGKAVLACETLLETVLAADSCLVKVQPLAGFPVIRDLMIDWRPTIIRMQSIQLWLEPMMEFGCDNGCLQTQAEYQAVKQYVTCIGCGICASVCPALKCEGFIEPFILVKAQRLVADSRASDACRQSVREKVRPYLPNCLHCGLCEHACPKGVSPLKAIECLSQDGKSR